MKNTFLLLAILFSVNTFGKSNDEKFVVDQTWKLLGTGEMVGRCEELVPQMKYRFHSRAENYYGLLFKYLIKDPSVEMLENQCAEVIYKNTFVNSKYSNTLYMQIYCKSRPFSDMAVMNLNCRKEPRQECFDPKILTRLESIPPTQFKEINMNECKTSRYLR